LDLFESHLELTALLEASTAILAMTDQELPETALAIARADRQWVKLWRYYWVFPPHSN
jgi:hypothetical protein